IEEDWVESSPPSGGIIKEEPIDFDLNFELSQMGEMKRELIYGMKDVKMDEEEEINGIACASDNNDFANSSEATINVTGFTQFGRLRLHARIHSLDRPYKMNHTAAGGDGGEVDAFVDPSVDPLAPVDVHAAANDDNVEAALLAIYAKAGHQPEKRIRETLETKELRTSHPVDLADFFRNPEGNSSSIPLTAAQLEKALRKEQRTHREERKEMYRRLNLSVPPGRPNIEREAQLREQLLALDEKERLEKQEKEAAAMRAIVEQGMDGEDRIDVRHLYEGVVKEE
ncbi:hypothetical protein PFISCL1PPCAC_894, partial [Pristionchus fissidentatus]